MSKKLRPSINSQLSKFLGVLFLFNCVLIISAQALLNTYSFSSGTGTVDPMTTGTITTLVAAGVDNGASVVTNIGFTFSLDGTPYTQFSVNSNGLMRLGSTAASTTSSNQLIANAEFPKIVAYWDNLLTTASTGGVKSKVIGSAPNRILIVDWKVTIQTPNTSGANFQVWLYETSNNIQFIYGSGMVANTGGYTVGIAASAASNNFFAVTTSTSTASTTTANDANSAAIASGVSYRFAIPPGCPTLTFPAANATNVSMTPTLTWNAGSGFTSGYDVYFGTAASPPRVSYNQAGTSYTPATLNANTTYFWKVVARNDSAQSASCSTIQFTTIVPPSCPVISYPAANAVSIPISNMVLSWSAGVTGTTDGYDVYFGTTANPPLVSTNQAGTTYNAGVLSQGTVYYWKVIGRNGLALSTGCSVNQFTTVRLSYEVTRSTGITFNSIASTGSSVPAGQWRSGTNTDDNLSNPINIGFSFSYNGGTFSQFLVSTNGFITFNSSTAATGSSDYPYGYLNDALSNGTASTVSTLVVAPFYEDIYCQGNPTNQAGLDNSIKYQLTGSVGSRILTVEWIAMEGFNSSGPNLNFQVKLYEGSNKIEFVYGAMEGFDGASNVNYSYSCGLNSSTLSTTPVSGELLDQITADTRNFGLTSSSQLNQVPECNSMITFTQGIYTPYVPPASNAPVNDASANAITLPVYTSPCTGICGNIYSSAHGTSSGVALCSVSSGNADDDVWFKFTAVNTSASIKVQGSGNYDPSVQLLSSTLTPVACAYSSFGVGSSETINTTVLTVGQIYYVRVYDRGAFWGTNSSGQFAICISSIPLPPVNDECANSIPITVTQNITYTTGTSTYAATPTSGITACTFSGTNPDDDVWYKFTAVNTMETINVAGATGFNAVIQLFSGSCASLNPIACTNFYGNGQTETINATGLTRNATYYFRVYHALSGGGSGNYSVSVSSPPPPCTSTMLPPNNETDVLSSNTLIYWDPVPGADNYRLMLDLVNPPVQQQIITTDTFAIINSLATSSTYYWSVQPGNATGFNSSCIVFNFTTEARPNSITIRAFLEGLYNPVTGTMASYLNPADTITDSVTVELWDIDTIMEVSVNTVISKNGYITAFLPSFTSGIEYYIVLKTRNHLETWSSLFLYGTDTVFDFTDTIDKAFGNNMVQVAPNVYALYCWDVNQDGLIDGDDVTSAGQQAATFNTGFLSGDANYDNTVESVDLSLIENKKSLNRQRIYPFGP